MKGRALTHIAAVLKMIRLRRRRRTIDEHAGIRRRDKSTAGTGLETGLFSENLGSKDEIAGAGTVFDVMIDAAAEVFLDEDNAMG